MLTGMLSEGRVITRDPFILSAIRHTHNTLSQIAPTVLKEDAIFKRFWSQGQLWVILPREIQLV